MAKYSEREDKNSLTRKDLAVEIEEILELFSTSRLHKSKGMKIVNAVFKAIQKGMEEDGSVKIEGFGHFRVVEHKPRLRPASYFRDGKVVHTEYKLTPSKKYAKFHAYKCLTDFVSIPIREAEASNARDDS